jgi:hypothetical protein
MECLVLGSKEAANLVLSGRAYKRGLSDRHGSQEPPHRRDEVRLGGEAHVTGETRYDSPVSRPLRL